ncbi:hypothetical protein DL93DRAFT_273692 [Clavulina sp. PMI_390]|nr:hypothetical protein DL93DRAFT_273692 [Clavulina sp. PMI_390]
MCCLYVVTVVVRFFLSKGEGDSATQLVAEVLLPCGRCWEWMGQLRGACEEYSEVTFGAHDIATSLLFREKVLSTCIT